MVAEIECVWISQIEGQRVGVVRVECVQRRASGLLSYRGYDWDLHIWLKVGWWWIAWMFLSGGLLAASLIVFRAVGYRLVRRKYSSRSA